MVFKHPFEKEIYGDYESKFLILGSFPSLASKEFGYFYGNKNNVFWKILGDIFCKNKEEKEFLKQRDKNIYKEFCKKHGIVLYDIVQSYDGEEWCSNDTDLFKQKNIKYSNKQIEYILTINQNLKIFGTSKKVVAEYKKQKFKNYDNIIYLTSPSPRNTIKYEQKLAHWKIYLF